MAHCVWKVPLGSGNHVIGESFGHVQCQEKGGLIFLYKAIIWKWSKRAAHTSFWYTHPGPSSTPVVKRALYWPQGQILTLIWNQKVHNIPSCNILGYERFIGISQTWPQFFIYKNIHRNESHVKSWWMYSSSHVKSQSIEEQWKSGARYSIDI